VTGGTLAGFSRILASKLRSRNSVSTPCIPEDELDLNRIHFDAKRMAAIRMPSSALRDMICGKSRLFRRGLDPVSISYRSAPNAETSTPDAVSLA
jgi:hypothetical protein